MYFTTYQRVYYVVRAHSSRAALPIPVAAVAHGLSAVPATSTTPPASAAAAALFTLQEQVRHDTKLASVAHLLGIGALPREVARPVAAVADLGKRAQVFHWIPE